MTTLLLTTHFGMEDMALEEMRERVGRAGLGDVQGVLRPGGHRGHLQVSSAASLADLRPVLKGMRSVHHALRGLDTFELPDAAPVEAICERVAALEIDDLCGAASFRVRCKRVGEHTFESPDVERAAGAVLVGVYGVRVDLREPAVTVRVDVRDQVCTVSVALTSRPLSIRHNTRPYRQRTSLKASVAWAMLRLSGLRADGESRILDPFCGSGSILLEAGEVLPLARLFGSDFRTAAAEGSARNVEAAGLTDRATVLLGDAQRLGEAWGDATFDAVITNPPYGARMGRGLRFEGFYRVVLEHLRPRLTEGAPLVLLTLRPEVLAEVAAALGGYRFVTQRRIESGGVTATAVVLRAAV